MKRLLRVFKILGIVAILLLLLVTLTLDLVGRSVANKMLPEALHTKASLGGLHIGLVRGVVGLRNLRVGQPGTFTNDGPDLLTLGRFGANVKLGSLPGSGPIVVQRVELSDLLIHIVRNATGELNVAQLGSTNVPEVAVEAPSNAPPVVVKEAAPARRIVVEHIRIKHGLIRYTDRQLGDGTPVDVTVKDLDLALDGLVIDPAAGPVQFAPALLELTARLPRAGGHDVRLGAVARIGPVGGGIPAVQGALRLIGFELAPVGGLLPPGVMAALGGSGLDLVADAAVATNMLKVDGAMTMDGGSRFPVTVGGTPDQPVFDKSSVLFGAFGRLSGGVQGSAAVVADTGMAAAGTVVHTAGSIAGGALKTVGSLGHALGSTAMAGLSGDMKGVGSGLVATVSAPVSGVYDTVTNTTRSVVSGLGDSAKALRGKTAFEDWRKDTDKRWDKTWSEARANVEKAPWPPVPKAASP
jgi:hypothetical protein